MKTRQAVAMGGAVFAACMLLMVGVFNLIYGLPALIKGVRTICSPLLW
jgi:hypothetical protein